MEKNSKSQKVYLAGQRFPDLRIPMRQVQITKSNHQNESLLLYDTSGPYGDPKFASEGSDRLPRLRTPWIDGRDDTARTANGRRRAKVDANVTQLHYARK